MQHIGEAMAKAAGAGSAAGGMPGGDAEAHADREGFGGGHHQQSHEQQDDSHHQQKDDDNIEEADVEIIDPKK